MTATGFVLVHGLRGSPANLAPLTRSLVERHGEDAVTPVSLPGDGRAPCLDIAALCATVAEAVEVQRAAGRRLVLIGHSTGGNLLLAHLARDMDPPALLVLAGTPPLIDISYARRWERHIAEVETEPGASSLLEVGTLVTLVNRHSKRERLLQLEFPTLILQGEADQLVPPQDLALWRDHFLAGPTRLVRIPGAGHQLFRGHRSELVVDLICRESSEPACDSPEDATRRLALRELVPAIEPLLRAWPHSQRHLVRSPAGCAATGDKFHATAIAPCEPTVANIEVTTHCNLACPACARAFLSLRPRHMRRADFRHILGLLPHALRITLVGLGEPLLHPEIADLVAMAAEENRIVSLVTNGMALERKLARDLCDAGLAGITFSIDAVEPELVRRVRRGADPEQLFENIRGFIEEKNRPHRNRRVVTSAFSVLSAHTVDALESIANRVADLSIDALMVTDLNFERNSEHSLHRSLDPVGSKSIRRALKTAVARRLPVLSVHALEEFALEKQYRRFLLFRAEGLRARSERRRHCFSPWQAVPVNVDGEISLCDCQPEAEIGNLLETGLDSIWNGERMVQHRMAMVRSAPPAACLACPRF